MRREMFYANSEFGKKLDMKSDRRWFWGIVFLCNKNQPEKLSLNRSLWTDWVISDSLSIGLQTSCFCLAIGLRTKFWHQWSKEMRVIAMDFFQMLFQKFNRVFFSRSQVFQNHRWLLVKTFTESGLAEIIGAIREPQQLTILAFEDSESDKLSDIMSLILPRNYQQSNKHKYAKWFYDIDSSDIIAIIYELWVVFFSPFDIAVNGEPWELKNISRRYLWHNGRLRVNGQTTTGTKILAGNKLSFWALAKKML